jgi:hypothetical protein
LRRSGRLRVNTVICGDSLSTKMTGMVPLQKLNGYIGKSVND